MAAPDRRYAFPLELHTEAVCLLDADPQLADVVLEVIRCWREGSTEHVARLAQWELLIRSRDWSILADNRERD